MDRENEWVWRPGTEFRGSVFPEPARIAGYSALIERFSLQIPVPPHLAGVAVRRKPTSSESWLLLPNRVASPVSFIGHLDFALKHEGVNLLVLNAVFRVVPKEDLEDWIRSEPSGANTRRAWFLYEWLTGATLDVQPTTRLRAVPVIDGAKQFGLEGGNRSARHSVIDNLPGTRDFCPLVRRTPKLDAFEAQAFDQRARRVIGRTHPDVVARAAAFLVLKDSKSSFFIESERPTRKIAARWAQAIAEAGTRQITVQELERLQRVVIADARFVHLGLRQVGGFVGDRDRGTREPLPDHISARWQDLESLMRGVEAYAARAMANKVDAVTTAAALAFGFVYIHPFEDGNGRIHRWLFHHILCMAQYNPPGVVFPISSTICRRIEEYRDVLESYSKPLLDFIDWRPTADGNVDVLNDTADYYRFFDATRHAEFLYECVQHTVERDLPEEVAYLEAYDKFSSRVLEIVDMPNRTVDLLHNFLAQNGGTLLKRARTEEFAPLTDEETAEIEQAYAAAFAGIQDRPAEPEEPPDTGRGEAGERGAT